MNFSGCDSRAQSLHPFLSQTPSNQRRDGRLDQNWQGDLFGPNLFPAPLFQEPAVEDAVCCSLKFQQKCQISFCILYSYVLVQFYLWFKFYFFCFKLIIIYHHTQKQKKIKFKPRIKLNHNIYTTALANKEQRGIR